MKRLLLLSVLMVSGIAACGAGSTDPEFDHAQAVLDWRADRLQRLRAPHGYLNLVGLYRLEDGVSTFGGGEDNDLVFPRAPDANVGEFELGSDGVAMTVRDGVDVRVEGETVTSLPLPDDTRDGHATVTYASLAWTVIKRQDMIFVRLFDYENPAAGNLPPIPQFDIDQNWRLDATLKRHDEPKVMDVGTVIEGLGWNPQSPGMLEFEIDGETHSLEAYASSGGRLLLVFGDRTSGRETYPAGRFLYTDPPDEQGRTVIDFNMAYNPPCAFNDFATCPVASPRNRLPVEITAGEKYIDDLHVGVAH